jgi:uncharacterized Fe-S radical SAM superfamily protein PflX
MITNIIDVTIETGDLPFLTIDIWFSGCNIRCCDCHNGALYEKRDGYSLDEVKRLILERKALSNYVLFIGGEPTNTFDLLVELNQWCIDNSFTTILFTGTEYCNDYDVFDYVKTGCYEADKLVNDYHFISSNQKVLRKGKTIYKYGDKHELLICTP